MTTLLSFGLAPFASHHRFSPVTTSKSLPVKSRSLISSSLTSISLPVLPLEHLDAYPALKPSGSLPDLSTMVASLATEGRHRASSLNDDTNTFPPSPPPTGLGGSSRKSPQMSLFSIPAASPAPLKMSPAAEELISSILASTADDSNNNNIHLKGKQSPAASQMKNPTEMASVNGQASSGEEPPLPPTNRRRKNSSMTPVVPDLELMAKLRLEDEERDAQLAKERRDASKADCGDSFRMERETDDPLNGPMVHLKEWQQYGGSEKESASAWLAAATQRSPQARRKSGVLNFTSSNGFQAGPLVAGAAGSYKSCSAEILSPPYPGFNLCQNVVPPQVTQVEDNALTDVQSGVATCPEPVKGSSSPPPVKPKLLQPFGKNDRVRRTSILRPPSSFVPAASAASATPISKKKVSFADTRGKALENVRYFAPQPPPVTRRYSSYTAPTASYLSNGNYNSPWNLALNGNGPSRQSLHTVSPSLSTEYVPAAAAGEPVHDHDFSHAKLAPRYELVASNFTSPSLQPTFSARLEAQSILLHSVTTAETTVYGTVSVMNRHFNKKVTVRYTFNEWASFIEREASYMLGSHDGTSDKFSFVMYARPADFAGNLAASFSAHPVDTYLTSSRTTVQSTHPRVYFALRFTTGDGQDYWDNNEGRNYCLNLTSY